MSDEIKYCFLKSTWYPLSTTGDYEHISDCHRPCTNNNTYKKCGWWMTEDEMQARWATIPHEFKLKKTVHIV